MQRPERRSSCAPCALCFAAVVLLANGIAAQIGWKPLREYTGGMPAFDVAAPLGFTMPARRTLTVGP